MKSILRDSEYPLIIRIEDSDSLLALARVSEEKFKNKKATYSLKWMRSPSQEDVNRWLSELNHSLKIGYLLDIPKNKANSVYNRLLARMFANYLDTRYYSHQIDEVYKSLYRAENKLGIQNGISSHFEEDIGL